MVACGSINMRIFKTSEFILFLLSIVWSSNGAPGKPSLVSIARSPEDSPGNVDEKPQFGDHYDQRQNGTENYRIHVDGLVLVVAPIEGLLLAGGFPGAGDSSIFGTTQQQDEPIAEKPKPEEPSAVKPAEEKPPSGKSSHGNGLRLINLLSPFLRRVHPHQ